MHKRQQFPNVIFGASLRPEGAALAIMVLLLFLMFVLLFMTLTAQTAQAQTFKVLYAFTGGADGDNPCAGVTMDRSGNLYGTTIGGGYTGGACYSYGCGTVFKLSNKGPGWVFNPLYSFQGEASNDGQAPLARVIFGPDGSLYGTTYEGGKLACDAGLGCGTVFNLRPYPTACKTGLCGWQEAVLHDFADGDGIYPSSGDLVFGRSGNLYGTTSAGAGYGTVYELKRSDGGWTGSILYSFTGGNGGGTPHAGVIFDKVGSLYGTTAFDGAYGYGVVYQLTPSGSAWTENILYCFQNLGDGTTPLGGLIFDESGNLYGTTSGFYQSNGSNTVFELTPSGGNWMFTLLHFFSFGSGGPDASLVMDASGNLYGTTVGDGAYGYGNVFKLTPSNGGWTYTSLHDFTGGSDGGNNEGCSSNVALDVNGNLYGTTEFGGNNGSCAGVGCGVVWEIMP